MLYEFLQNLLHNIVFELVLIAILMDTFFGVLRAIKQRVFNSCIGINGILRKIGMIASLMFMAIFDRLIDFNLISFLPEDAIRYLPDNMNTIGFAEFFGILYLCYEIVSILKNMTLCGLPVKKVWETVRAFLGKYTEELPAENVNNAEQHIPEMVKTEVKNE